MLTSGRMKSSQKAGPPPCFFYALTSSLGSFERPHRTHISCSGRALCRPRTKPHPNRRDVRSCVRTNLRTKTLISCSGRAPKPASHQPHILTVGTYVRASASDEQPSNTKTHISCSGRALCRPRTKPHPNRRDVRSCVRTDETPNRMRSWHTFINITLIIFRLSFGCEAGTRRGHYNS